jgi:hypothetical protein
VDTDQAKSPNELYIGMYARGGAIHSDQKKPMIRIANEQGCVGYLGHLFEIIGQLCPMKEAFLLKHLRWEYNQHGPCCAYALTMRSFSQ